LCFFFDQGQRLFVSGYFLSCPMIDDGPRCSMSGSDARCRAPMISGLLKTIRTGCIASVVKPVSCQLMRNM